MPQLAVRASVLVGSVNGGESIHTLLDSLARQTGDIAFEVIVADRCRDGTAERIEATHPQVRVIRADPRTTLPQLRALALADAAGSIVFVTEDHTVAPPDWIEGLVGSLERAPDHVAAAGGPVENAMTQRAVDWAAFLCEYSRYLPSARDPGGEVDDIPGMNIAYRREALDAAGPEALTRGFWESTVHPALLASGQRFLKCADCVILHRKHFGFAYFVAQRFHYSRYFAGERFPPQERGRRALYTVLSAALPPVLLIRMARDLRRSPRHLRASLRAVPALICFALVWGAGEAVGYAFGPGDSLVKVE
jgi:glycosyltransferase involved in cell wall biosynthesis